MRGIGVSRSEMLQILTQDNYYITKVQWTTAEILSTGAVYEIEAGFDDPQDCTGFSFILSGVYAVEAGVVSNKKRQPLSSETDKVSRAIDAHSRSVLTKLRQGIIDSTAGKN